MGIGIEAPYFIYVLLGLLVGLLVGLTSIGAGAVTTPFVVLFLHVPPLLAVGSSIVFGAITKAFGTFLHLQQKTVDRGTVTYLLWGSVPAVALGSFGLRWLRNQDLSTANLWVSRLVGFALLVLGLCALTRQRLG